MPHFLSFGANRYPFNLIGIMMSIIFLTIVGSVVALLHLGVSGINKILFIYVVWCFLIAALSANHFFSNTASLPPRMLLVIVPAIIFVVFCYRYLNGKTKIVYLLSIHIFRVPIELVLFQLFKEGQVPRLMTFQGWNLDIITGLTAVPMLVVLIFKGDLPDKVFTLWNILGLILLAIVVATAILAAPSPVQILAHERPNIAILYFPYTLLPATVVPIVALSHLILLRRDDKLNNRHKNSS